MPSIERLSIILPMYQIILGMTVLFTVGAVAALVYAIWAGLLNQRRHHRAHARLRGSAAGQPSPPRLKPPGPPALGRICQTMSEQAPTPAAPETPANEPQPPPEVHRIADIVEQEGFVPAWVTWAAVIALGLAALMWIRPHGF